MSDTNALSWLNATIWPGQDAELSAREPHTQDTWWAAPSAAEPHTLIPTEPKGASLRSLRRYHDGQDWFQRLRSFGAESVRRIVPEPSFGPFGQYVSLHGTLDAGITGGLREVLSAPAATFAFTLGAPKSNRKPILQILDGTECVGFAKVATNAWTRGLIENEASWLSAAASLPHRVQAPAVLFAGDIGGTFVLAQSAVTPPRLPRRSRLRAPALSVFDAVAALAPSGATRVADGAWWRSVLGATAAATTEELAVVDQTREQLKKVQHIGSWHGDLAPWNMFSSNRTVFVIDWEFGAVDVPWGFDLCHFYTQTAVELVGLQAPAALDWAYQRALRALDGLDLRGTPPRAVWDLYLVELIRRQLALRASGVDAEVTQGPAAMAWLRSNRPTTGR